MCTSGVRSALDDLFGRDRQDDIEDGNPVDVIYVDQHSAEGATVVIDGTTYTVTDGHLVIDAQIDPITVNMTLEFWGISISLPSVTWPSGGEGGSEPTMLELAQ